MSAEHTPPGKQSEPFPVAAQIRKTAPASADPLRTWPRPACRLTPWPQDPVSRTALIPPRRWHCHAATPTRCDTTSGYTAAPFDPPFGYPTPRRNHHPPADPTREPLFPHRRCPYTG